MTLENEISQTDEQSTATPESQSEQQQEAKKYKVKVDQEEIEVDESELISNYQLAKASHKRFQESAQRLKEVEDLIALTKQDPSKMFEALQIDPTQWMQQYIEAQLEEQSLTDEQRELRDLRRFKQQQEEERKQKEELTKQEQAKQQEEAFLTNIDNQINEVLTKNNVQTNPVLIRRMAEQMIIQLDNNEEIDAQKAYEATQQSINSELDEYLKSIEAQVLLEKLGHKKEDIRKALLSSVSNQSQSSSPKKEQANTEKKGKKTGRELFGDIWNNVL